MDEKSYTYKEFVVEYNLYGQREYTVQYNGDDLWFNTPEEANAFIDSVL